jgi:hypothetical protein
MATKYTKLADILPSVLKIYQHLPLQDPPKFTQIVILGLKIYHLATLVLSKIVHFCEFLTSKRRASVWRRVARCYVFEPKIPI